LFFFFFFGQNLPVTAGFFVGFSLTLWGPFVLVWGVVFLYIFFFWFFWGYLFGAQGWVFQPGGKTRFFDCLFFPNL